MTDQLLGWLNLACIAGTLLFAIYTARSKASSAKIADIETAVDKKAAAGEVALLIGKAALMEHRVTVMETEIKHMPDGQTANELQRSVIELSGKVEVLSERLKPVAATLERVQEFMMQQPQDRR